MFQIYLLKWYTTTLLNTGMETSHFYSHDIDQDKKTNKQTKNQYIYVKNAYFRICFNKLKQTPRNK